ncbi:MAG: hypothetical protein AB8B64_18845 [Granulosicoccus sp.]
MALVLLNYSRPADQTSIGQPRYANPPPAGKQSLLRGFLLSMAGIAALFSIMTLSIWMSTNNILSREKQLINELLPELDVAHQLTSATAGLQSQSLSLRSSQTANELGDHQIELDLTIADIQQTLNATTTIKADVITYLRQSVDGVSEIAADLSTVRSEQIDIQINVREEIDDIFVLLSDLEKDVEREIFSLTGRLLSISNSIVTDNAAQRDNCSSTDIFSDRVSDYDDISLAIQDYLLLGRDIVSLNSVLEKLPLLTDKKEVVLALKTHDLLIRALTSRSTYISNAGRTDTLLKHLSSLRAQLGDKQRIFSLQDIVVTQEQDQTSLSALLKKQTTSILERTDSYRTNTRDMVNKLTNASLDGLRINRLLPMIVSAVAMLLLGAISYWLLYRKTVLPLIAITRQLDDVGSVRFPTTCPNYYFKENSALSSAMIQLDTAQKKLESTGSADAEYQQRAESS